MELYRSCLISTLKPISVFHSIVWPFIQMYWELRRNTTIAKCCRRKGIRKWKLSLSLSLSLLGSYTFTLSCLNSMSNVHFFVVTCSVEVWDRQKRNGVIESDNTNPNTYHTVDSNSMILSENIDVINWYLNRNKYAVIEIHKWSKVEERACCLRHSNGTFVFDVVYQNRLQPFLMFAVPRSFRAAVWVEWCVDFLRLPFFFASYPIFFIIFIYLFWLVYLLCYLFCVWMLASHRARAETVSRSASISFSSCVAVWVCECVHRYIKWSLITGHTFWHIIMTIIIVVALIVVR